MRDSHNVLGTSHAITPYKPTLFSWLSLIFPCVGACLSSWWVQRLWPTSTYAAILNGSILLTSLVILSSATTTVKLSLCLRSATMFFTCGILFISNYLHATDFSRGVVLAATLEAVAWGAIATPLATHALRLSTVAFESPFDLRRLFKGVAAIAIGSLASSAAFVGITGVISMWCPEYIVGLFLGLPLFTVISCFSTYLSQYRISSITILLAISSASLFIGIGTWLDFMNGMNGILCIATAVAVSYTHLVVVLMRWGALRCF